jgi:tRNA pseudouridine55 synthase
MALNDKRSRRDVGGIVLVDKPAGITSNRTLQIVKRIFMAAKAGHTGSLDPLATGMLPVCLGSATKVSGLLLDSAKTYRVTARLGVATDTGDADGAVIGENEAPALGGREVAAALAAFCGEIEQIPPMYSALKHHGRRLYELARRGKEVERAPRRVRISRLDLERVEWPHVEFVVACSKGTYVRSLVIDIAERLGTIGHVVALRRLEVEPFSESQMLDLARLRELAEQGVAALDQTLLPPDTALAAWPGLWLDADQARLISRGQRLTADPARPTGLVRLYSPGDRFLGIGEVLATGELRSRRLFLD